LPNKPTIGQIVIYRLRTEPYDLPAIISAAEDTLDPKSVELGHVPPLTGCNSVHLTVFTCGKQRRLGNVVNDEVAGGSYQEFDVPQAEEPDIDEPAPGTWRWPECG